jgi:hypothetical protein
VSELGERAGSQSPRTRLENWQKRLADHFSGLATTRRKADWPVFALEHGLSESERDTLIKDVRACARMGPRREVALPWIVYAAEIGYHYSGYEYWQTFEEETPGWLTSRQWREELRARFRSFATSYNGAEPDGDWAGQFRIIAWPITHGVLPRDLQRQLAELLYDASITFRAETFASAETLGRHLQARSFGYSSRFRQFAENGILLGQIALALLLQEKADALGGTASSILDAGTLSRVVDDLNRETDARQWLAAARSSAARFRVRGLSRLAPTRGSDGSPPNVERHNESPRRAEPLPRPRIVLREEVPDRWKVRLELPNLSHLAARSPRSREILVRTQGRVAGATPPILASGRIVRDALPTVTLSAWPSPQTQLLAFDGAPTELDAVLRASFRLDPRPSWLFLIGNDGEARELTSGVLRAGASYLLLQSTETRNPAAGLGLRVVQLSCSGIFGLRIDVPRDVTDVFVGAMEILHLKVTKTLEVWPAGLPALEWNGQGQAAWVAGQPVVLGIRSDHRLARITFTIDGVRHPDIPIVDNSLGASSFVQLPPLVLGRHRIGVEVATFEDRGQRAGTASGALLARGLKGELTCDIREPRTAAGAHTGALSFVLVPASPSLEDVWEDRFEIHVAAPGVDRLRCRFVLRASSGEDLLTQLIVLPSPCDTDSWRREFARIRDAAEARYDEANAAILEFDAGALGRRRVLIERDFRSLRWAVKAKGHQAVLIDSQGTGDIRVHLYRCTAPSLPIQLDPETAQLGVEVEDAGGLFVARREQQVVAVVAVPHQSARDFATLLVRSQVPAAGYLVDDIRRLIELALLWEGARLGGAGLTNARRQASAQAILSSVFGALGGRVWEDVEKQVRSGGELGSILRTNAQIIGPATLDEGTKRTFGRRFAPFATIPQVNLEEEFVRAFRLLTSDARTTQCARFAIRLATSATAARDWAESHPLAGEVGRDEIDRYLTFLRGSQFTARAARYVALLRIHSARD